MSFMDWWNRLALINGKEKFRNEREAALFVQRVYRNSGGPNEKMKEMRREYERAVRTKRERDSVEVKG